MHPGMEALWFMHSIVKYLIVVLTTIRLRFSEKYKFVVHCPPLSVKLCSIQQPYRPLQQIVDKPQTGEKA